MKQLNPTSPHEINVTANTEDLILQKVSSLLSPYNRTNIEIKRETEIMADLEVDSVAVFDLIMEVEDAYEITFPMETVSETNTVGDLVDTIRALKKA